MLKANATKLAKEETDIADIVAFDGGKTNTTIFYGLLTQLRLHAVN